MILKKYATPLLFLFCFFFSPLMGAEVAPVLTGIDAFISQNGFCTLRGKKVALVTNHTAVSKNLETTREIFLRESKKYGFTITAFFAPEHGLYGAKHASEKVETEKGKIPVFSLHGETRRPTEEMLKNIDLLFFDIQDIGSRSYTYISTLFYVMEEAAKKKIPVVVFDRPNPINGLMIDGPMMQDAYRSFVGYINVPYCHGMTIGELAQFFNQEYKVHTSLTVIPMQGWKRYMTFRDTKLPWIPLSPHIPDPETCLYYPLTGLVGELQMISIGVGYTLPFKILGAPWIKENSFLKAIQSKNFPGIKTVPFYFKPFYGKFSQEECQGTLFFVEDPLKYKPVTAGLSILGILKDTFPKEFTKVLPQLKKNREMFLKTTGTDLIYLLLTEENGSWSLNSYLKKVENMDAREKMFFLEKRKKYLIPSY